jgi:cation:H+ antiporter
MILSSSVVLLMSLDGVLARSDGLILILLYIPYVISVLRKARHGVDKADTAASRTWRNILVASLLTLAGIAGVIVSSKFALDSGMTLGTAVGISAAAMGVIFFAFGTSLPELAISVSATFRRKGDVTIGEVYASNIFTQLVVLGICCLISPIAVPASMTQFAMPFLVLAAVVIQIFVTSDLRVDRVEAIGLLLFYAIFAASQFLDLPSPEQLLGF